jgi:hypothetical protein
MNRIILLIALLFQITLHGQDLNEEFRELAEYRIIQQALSFWEGREDWNFYPYFDHELNSLLEKKKSKALKYSVKEIYKIENIRIIEIEDKTNIGSFPNHKYLFAIQKQANNETLFQYEVDSQNVLYFINNLVYAEYPDIQKSQLIELYNLLNFHDQNTVFYNGKNGNDFKILEDEFKLEDFNKTYEAKDTLYFTNVFRNIINNIIYYYHINYEIDCKELSVEKVLLYKIKV